MSTWCILAHEKTLQNTIHIPVSYNGMCNHIETKVKVLNHFSKRGHSERAQETQNLVSAFVSEIKLCLLGAEVNPRPLGHHLQVNGLVWLHAHHQLIPLALFFKYVSRNVAELQPHLCLPLIQSLTTAENEWNSWRASGRWDERIASDAIKCESREKER